MIRWVAAIVHDPPDSERSINAKDVSIPTSIDEIDNCEDHLQRVRVVDRS